MTKPKRYAAGRARALGLATRGTTTPQRLRRVDRWLLATHPPQGLVVDLGFGASPVTTVELYERLGPGAEVIGLEIDPERVAAAQPAARDGLAFHRGGFELAGLRPSLVRAMNVLRQYDEEAAHAAWRTVLDRLAPGGAMVEGTCDEPGRLAAWVLLDASGPRTLTLATHLSTLRRPSVLAERLPKALIHHNVPGQPVHALFQALDAQWDLAATPYGARQRWVTTCERLVWPGAQTRRARFGELTVPWETVAPV